MLLLSLIIICKKFCVPVVIRCVLQLVSYGDFGLETVAQEDDVVIDMAF